jgi:hypothetical protein
MAVVSSLIPPLLMMEPFSCPDFHLVPAAEVAKLAKNMRDMGEKRRHHGHVHAVGSFGAGVGGGHADHEERKHKEQKLDISGMNMDTIPHLNMPLGNITTLDLSNNNLQVGLVSTFDQK